MKKYLVLALMVLLCAILFVGCGGNNAGDDVNVDYSEYPFVNVSWTRDTDICTETIRFGEDGSFTYSCACGDPVNDSDLCDGFIYDDETKVITFDCVEETDEMVTEIILVKCDEAELQLDFDGDVRTFTMK